MHPTCTHHHEDPTTKKHQTGKRINEESIGGKRKHHLGQETIPAIGLHPPEAGGDKRGKRDVKKKEVPPPPIAAAPPDEGK